MADADDKKAEEKPPKKRGSLILSVLVPAILAGAAAFGGARMSTIHLYFPRAASAPPPPGPTVNLEPFVLVTPDASKHMHPMRVAIAVEFDGKAKEEAIKPYTPRIRDATLAYLRSITYEEAMEPGESDRMRQELLERLHAVGAGEASRVLITDLVIQ
jgi:flagellar basal body-associated protein FliL